MWSIERRVNSDDDAAMALARVDLPAPVDGVE